MNVFKTLATLLVVAATIGGSAKADNAFTFTVFEQDTNQQALNLGDPATGVGNMFTVGGDLIDQSGAKVGRSAALGVSTSPTELLTTATLTIHGSQIQFQGMANVATFFTGQPTTFAVTGGTGTYATARGTVTIAISPTNGSQSVVTVRLILAGGN